MAIRTTNNSSGFTLAPAGVHVARCCRVIDCGTRVDPTFGKRRRQAWIFWELPKSLRDDGEPNLIGKRYTLSHNEKANLRADLESWYGRHFDEKALDDAGGFDLEKLVGRPGLINVVHSQDGKYANVASVMPLPAGMECPPAVTPEVVFGFEPYSQAVFDTLSQGMQEYIKGSEEWQLAVNGHDRRPAAPAAGQAPAAAPARDDDVPFAAPAGAPAAARPRSKFDDMADDIPFASCALEHDVITRKLRGLWE